MPAILRYTSIIAVLVLRLHAAQAAASQVPLDTPLPLKMVASGVKSVSSKLEYSNDGRWMAYVETGTSIGPRGRSPYSPTGVPDPGGGKPRLVVIDTHTKRTVAVASESAWTWGPAWSPDSRHLAFYSDESGKLQIWVWDVGPSKARPLGQRVARPAERYLETALWAADSQHLLCKVLPESLSISEANDRSSARDKISPLQPPVPFSKVGADTASVYVYNSRTPLDHVSRGRAVGHPDVKSASADLVLLDLHGHVSHTVLSDAQVRWYAFSPDEQHIAVSLFTDWDVSAYQGKFELAVYEPVSGSHTTLGTDLTLNLGTPCSWSPDGKNIACLTAKSDPSLVGSLAQTNQLSVFQTDPARRTTIAQNLSVITTYLGGPLWSHDSKSLYLVGTDEKPVNSLTWYWNKRDRLWKADLSSTEAKVLLDIPGQQITQVISSDGRTSWSLPGSADAWIFTRTLGGRTTMSGPASLYRVSLGTGQSHRELQINTHWAYYSAANAASGTIVYAATTLQTPEDLWTLNLKDRTTSRLTHLNPQWDRYRLGTGQILDYQDIDGRELHAGLLLPPGYRHDRKVPLIVFAFGYPTDSSMINNFGMYGYYPSYNMHVLATRGYAVLSADMPLRPGSQMKDVAATVLPAINAAIDQAYVDPDRIGVMGYCIGSYTAVALALQSDRFKAVSIGGVTVVPDLASSYLYADPLSDNSKAYDDQADRLAMGASLWDQPDYFYNNSAAVFYTRLHTPLLMAQGSADGLFVSNVIYGALKRLHKEVEYRIYENEDHEISRTPNVIDLWQRRISFYDHYLDIARDARGRMIFDGAAAKSALTRSAHASNASSLQ